MTFFSVDFFVGDFFGFPVLFPAVTFSFVDLLVDDFFCTACIPVDSVKGVIVSWTVGGGVLAMIGWKDVSNILGVKP